jgi:hypothetical protein
MSTHNIYDKLENGHAPATGQIMYIPGTGYMRGWGTTAGNGVQNWAPGALWTKVTATTNETALYINIGTSSAASWVAHNVFSTADSLTIAGVIVPQYVYVNFVPQTTEAATDRTVFIAPRACKLIACSQIHSVAAGGASKLQVTKDTGTTAPGGGTDLLTNNTNTGFDLNATANTLQTGTLTSTAADVTFAAGDRLGIDFANTIQSTAGLAISATFQLV